MQSFKPQQAVSIRAACGVLGFDEPSVPPSRLNRLHVDQISVFPSLLGSYRGVRKSVPRVPIELFNAMRALLDARIRQIWRSVLQ